MVITGSGKKHMKRLFLIFAVLFPFSAFSGPNDSLQSAVNEGSEVKIKKAIADGATNVPQVLKQQMEKMSGPKYSIARVLLENGNLDYDESQKILNDLLRDFCSRGDTLSEIPRQNILEKSDNKNDPRLVDNLKSGREKLIWFLTKSGFEFNGYADRLAMLDNYDITKCYIDVLKKYGSLNLQEMKRIAEKERAKEMLRAIQEVSQ
jgi:hypothetical protein